MENCKITFIGGGNMARSLIGGLIANQIRPHQITVADPNDKQRQIITDQFDIRVFKNNNDAIKDADIIVLAVKPQLIYNVVNEITVTLKESNQLIISVAAGISLASIEGWFKEKTSIVRVMPNMPALVQAGATALYANQNVSDKQKNIAEEMIRSIGTVIWLKNEAQMDAVTALSGSGPAYFFYIMEAMEKAAVKMGLNREEARLLTIETALGSAKMALLSNSNPATLRNQVTSPGGTTEKAINIFKEKHLDQIIIDAMTAAKNRSIELSTSFVNQHD